MKTLGKIRRMRRIMTSSGHFAVVAMDQRAILTNVLAELKGVTPEELPFSDILKVKRLLVENLGSPASAMLFDPNIAVPAGIEQLPRDTGLIVAIEDHRVEVTDGGWKSSSIPSWTVEKIQRLGADAVKLLLWYHPDAEEEVLRHQQSYTKQIGKECAEQEIPFVLELLTYPLKAAGEAADKYAESAEKLPDYVIRSVAEFVKPEYQVDLLKLESPIPVKQLKAIDGNGPNEAFVKVGELCGRADIPWVLLSAGVTVDRFLTVLDHAYASGASGFMAGRVIWKEPVAAFPDINAIQKGLAEQGVEALNAILERTKTSARAISLKEANFSSLKVEGDFARKY